MGEIVPSVKLDLVNMPLQGRHLIEASAGTGKTFSITRIYLRLLLEQELPVEQILLMTYTRAATEELRGRIEITLRSAQQHWGQYEDEFWQQLYSKVEPQQAQLLLHQALLNLDQAAIFTIHGFCGRALQQYAFASQTGLEVVLETNTSDLAYTALQDWLRVTMLHSQKYTQLEQHGWHTPAGFWDAFSGALLSQTPVSATSPQVWHQAWQQNKLQVRDELLALEGQIISASMSDPKTAAVRLEQWQDLINWLATPDFDYADKTHLGCLNGARLGKAPELKPQVKVLLQRVNNEAFKTGYLKYAQQAAVAKLVQAGVEEIRLAYQLAKQQQQVMEFDDLVRRLSQCVNEVDNAALVSALQQAYPVALVDEFQDTDGHQYAILDALYPAASHSSALFMIGDPKQAIYGFRGGDIHAYLQAASAVDYRWHMETNWRSSEAMVAAYNGLFSDDEETQPESLLGAGIDYVKVQASAFAAANATDNPRAKGAAMHYVWLPTDGDTKPQTVQYKHQAMAQWCVAEIHNILQQGDFVASDIALLVRNGGEAQVLQSALSKAGLTSVYISDKTSIYASSEATEMLRLLNGILLCEDQRHLARAASTHLWGGNQHLLAQLVTNEDCQVATRSQMMSLRQLWLKQGVMALVVHLLKHQTIAPRVYKERYMTNMVQLAELLQKASTQASSALLLVEWLQQQCDENTPDASAELRLESDAKLIQIVTQHGAKGLEYPLVFIPFASQYKDPLKRGTTKTQLYQYHNPQLGCPELMIGPHPDVIKLTSMAAQQEAVRLLYVAVTRAQYRCYILASDFKHGQLSPLGQVLGLQPDTWQETLAAIAQPSSCCFTPVAASDTNTGLTSPLESAEQAQTQVLLAQTFSGYIDTSSNLLSYSGLVRNLSHQHQGGAKDQGDGIGQLVQAVMVSNQHQQDQQLIQELRFGMAKGKNTGLLLHDILEQVDFSQAHWPAAMEVPLARYHTVHAGLDNSQLEAQLSQWLEQCLLATLPTIGATIGDTNKQPTLCLQQLSGSQTLRESEFYFPLVKTKQGQLADILSAHRGGLNTSLPTYPILQGMMHGFIDLVFEHKGRYYLADYKSNHLGYCLDDYNHQAMLAANQDHYYDLQYLIYSLALHRYLGQRIANYDANTHFGGVYYLYLRGMTAGASTGVFATQVTVRELNALDQLFSGVNL
ncbi:MAG: exodeoxyribonuclease V subunit beta [Oceanospirillaceae bacterium]|jgi:exodeoxyribonuclease V beta subunit|nr:exodeoxyribonuclease V subunit beta [Oceanospirillaceae bacterium]MBT4443054.1 exodeoxyribonuclease V subunit beta [Oceanospirillaceae bacterium]